jgi:hypothetical protein
MLFFYYSPPPIAPSATNAKNIPVVTPPTATQSQLTRWTTSANVTLTTSATLILDIFAMAMEEFVQNLQSTYARTKKERSKILWNANVVQSFALPISTAW